MNLGCFFWLVRALGATQWQTVLEEEFRRHDFENQSVLGPWAKRAPPPHPTKADHVSQQQQQFCDNPLEFFDGLCTASLYMQMLVQPKCWLLLFLICDPPLKQHMGLITPFQNLLLVASRLAHSSSLFSCWCSPAERRVKENNQVATHWDVTHWFVSCRFQALSLDILSSAILVFWNQTWVYLKELELRTESWRTLHAHPHLWPAPDWMALAVNHTVYPHSYV